MEFNQRTLTIFAKVAGIGGISLFVFSFLINAIIQKFTFETIDANAAGNFIFSVLAISGGITVLGIVMYGMTILGRSHPRISIFVIALIGISIIGIEYILIKSKFQGNSENLSVAIDRAEKYINDRRYKEAIGVLEPLSLHENPQINSLLATTLVKSGYSNENYKRALDLSNNILNLENNIKLQHVSSIQKSFSVQSIVHRHHKEFSLAIGDMDKCLEFLALACPNDSCLKEKVECVGQKAAVFGSKFFHDERRSDFNESISLFKYAVEIDTQLGNEKGVVHSLSNIGTLYNIIGEKSKSTPFFKRALNIAENISDIPAIAQMHWMIANSYANSNIKEAEKHYEVAWRISIENEDQVQRQRARILGDYGSFIATQKGRMHEGLRLLNNSLLLNVLQNDKSSMGSQFSSISDVYQKLCTDIENMPIQNHYCSCAISVGSLALASLSDSSNEETKKFKIKFYDFLSNYRLSEITQTYTSNEKIFVDSDRCTSIDNSKLRRLFPTEQLSTYLNRT